LGFFKPGSRVAGVNVPRQEGGIRGFFCFVLFFSPEVALEATRRHCRRTVPVRAVIVFPRLVGRMQRPQVPGKVFQEELMEWDVGTLLLSLENTAKTPPWPSSIFILFLSSTWRNVVPL
jgi:hypothetical protein